MFESPLTFLFFFELSLGAELSQWWSQSSEGKNGRLLVLQKRLDTGLVREKITVEWTIQEWMERLIIKS